MYFIFPILTSISFYEKSKLDYQENHDQNQQLAVLGSVSRNNSKMDYNSENHGDLNKTNDDGNETVEDNFEITIEKHEDINDIHKTNADGAKTDTFETKIETIDEITVDKQL